MGTKTKKLCYILIMKHCHICEMNELQLYTQWHGRILTVTEVQQHSNGSKSPKTT